MTPLPGLEVTAPARREVQPSSQRSPPAPGGVATESPSHPEIALKAPRTAAGKAQLAAATQKRGRGEGSKGIYRENRRGPLIFRWFKFTLKPPYSIAHDKLRLAIWDTSFWTFWLKFGHKGP